jgi:hypothetical protein
MAELVIEPVATEEEAAAIVAAIEMTWPRRIVVASGPSRASGWRWSGRWWARPVAARRDRPWY